MKLLKSLEIESNFSSFDDFWLPFLGGQGPASSYVQSLSEMNRNLLQERLLVSEDRSIHLNARVDN